MNPMKQEIIKRAMDDFMRYGFKTFTMDDLARKLGMSKKTLYEYFPSKNDLVEACLDYALDITVAKADTFLQGEHSLIENVFRNQKKMQDIFNLNSVRPIWELKKYYPKTYERMDAEFTKCDYLFVDKILEQGWNENLFRKDIDLQFFKIFYVQVQRSSSLTDVFSENDFSLWYINHTVVEYIFRTLVNQKGLEELERVLQKLREEKII